MKSKEEIIGTTYVFDYSDSQYHITIQSQEILRWELTKGELDGPISGENPYLVNQVTDGILFLSWIEESGLQVYNVMNFNTGELITHGSWEGLFDNPGKVSVK